MPSESEYAKQERWRTDVHAFISALRKHWFWWLSASIGSGFAALCAAWLQQLAGGGKMIPFWVYETAAATGLVVASFRAFCDQRRIAEAKTLDLQAAIEKNAKERLELERVHAEEMARLEKTLDLLRARPPAMLEIEGMILDLKTTSQATKNACQIRVHNKATDKSAHNVQVELVDFEDSPANKDYFRPPRLLILPPEHKNDETINPGGHGTFVLFDAKKPVSVEGQSQGPVSAHFTRIDKWLLFEKNTNYRFTIKASAGDFPPTISEFNLRFIGEKYDCRFTLTKIKKHPF